MEKRLILLSLVFGLLCAGCVFAYSTMVKGEAEEARLEIIEEYGGEQVDVLVATRDIYPGETLDASNTSMEQWVSDLLPAQSITKEDDALGQKVTSLVVEGEVVTDKRLESNVDDISVPEGFVAVSVPAKNVQAVGGAIAVGDLVDVYAVGTTTACLGEGVSVLATSAQTSDTAGDAEVEWVTLAVAPDRAQEFVTASEGLQIYFTLPARQGEQGGQVAGEEESGQSGDAKASDSDADDVDKSNDGKKEEQRDEA